MSEVKSDAAAWSNFYLKKPYPILVHRLQTASPISWKFFEHWEIHTFHSSLFLCIHRSFSLPFFILTPPFPIVQFFLFSFNPIPLLLKSLFSSPVYIPLLFHASGNLFHLLYHSDSFLFSLFLSNSCFYFIYALLSIYYCLINLAFSFTCPVFCFLSCVSFFSQLLLLFSSNASHSVSISLYVFLFLSMFFTTLLMLCITMEEDSLLYHRSGCWCGHLHWNKYTLRPDGVFFRR